MLNRFLALPFLVILIAIAAMAMIIPAAHAASIKDFHVMRAFLQSSMIFLILTSLVAIATIDNPVKNPARSHLIALLATFIALPVMLAVPFYEAVGNTTFLNVYVEMVSSITTTGATLFDTARLPPSVHLWRALVAWMGGFFLWVTAIAILAPMNLGGFEVLSSSATGRGAVRSNDEIHSTDSSVLLARYAGRLFPIYAGLTLVLWIVLILAGDTSLVAFSHAMSTMSTSGISPVGGLSGSNSGVAGEAMIFIFLVFALSRQTFAYDQPDNSLMRLLADPEFRFGAALVAGIPVLLFVRHFLGAIEVDAGDDFGGAVRALWGSAFTVMSFLTTAGFESSDWSETQQWSGLATPGLILMGLVLVGGGVATTAGGVKLLRVYALFKHGVREIDKLVYPSSVAGAGAVARRLRRSGAQVAWIFFSLFALSLALVATSFAYTGLSFDLATTLAVAALSNTGPVINAVLETPLLLGTLSTESKWIFTLAMVLGRLETLAIIALFNPDFWRS